jgi:hypothetical protein
MLRKKEKNKKGQVAIFIILALAIVIILILLFLWRPDIEIFPTEKSPITQIRECVNENLQTVLEPLMAQGVSLDPEHYYLYQGTKLDYLCYTEENYKRCIMQKPLLKQSIENEITTYIKPRVRECINSVKISLQDQGYTVTSKTPEVSVSLIPNNIIVDIQPDLTISKDTTESYKSIKTDVNSQIYSLVMFASSISNWEARYGDSETMTYMVYYPSLKVEKKKQGDGTTVYILTDKNSGEVFMFASRSVALTPGLTGE